MIELLAFDVDGLPAPQGSKRVVPTARGPRLIESSGDKLKTWRAAVTLTARVAHRGRPPLDGPLCLRVGFMLKPPKTRRTDAPATRPDLDKLLRAVCDSLTDAQVWHDDGQVVQIVASKAWATDLGPGVSVLVGREATP